MNERAYKVPFEEQRAQALKEYNEMAGRVGHWSGFVEQAIKSYCGSEEIKKRDDVIKKFVTILRQIPLALGKDIEEYLSELDKFYQKEDAEDAVQGDEKPIYPGMQYQNLFNKLRDFNFIALQSEMDDVIQIVHRDFPQSKPDAIQELIKFINAMKTKQTLLNRCEIETIHIPSLIHKCNELANLNTKT